MGPGRPWGAWAAATFCAFIAVGLTAPAYGPFSISVHPVLWRMDAAAVAESRASVLGLDVDIKIGAMHVHLGWSAVPFSKL